MESRALAYEGINYTPFRIYLAIRVGPLNLRGGVIKFNVKINGP